MKSRDEVLNLAPDELEAKLVELLGEMENLQLQKATHQITNPLRIRTVRRNIARVMTLINEHKNGIRKIKVEEK
ncbi:MAG: 50S ribosomal protein L29 [Calditrichia bacterium]|jgi:large subunit ribosomal protein L29|nr:50S ribosomal protein L29 [Calditrichia bacterium]